MRTASRSSIPVVEPDFAAMEKARLVREQKASGKVKELKGKLAKVLASRTERDFVDAADEMALWVIAEQSIPEGIGVKAMAGELKDCFEALPKKGYACEATRTNNGVCFVRRPPRCATVPIVSFQPDLPTHATHAPLVATAREPRSSLRLPP